MTEDTPFIETLGEASYEERPVVYPAEVVLRVQVPFSEADQVNRLGRMLDGAVTEVLDQLSDEFESIQAGGSRLAVCRDGRRNDKTSEFEKKYLIRANDWKVIDRLTIELAGIGHTDQADVSCYPRQPEFESDKKAQTDAYSAAIEEARIHADNALAGSGKRAGDLISAKQLALAKRNSGVFGDEDWRGDTDRFAPRYHVGGAPSLEIEDPTRTIFVRFLARFKVRPKD